MSMKALTHCISISIEIVNDKLGLSDASLNQLLEIAEGGGGKDFLVFLGEIDFSGLIFGGYTFFIFCF